MSSNHPQQSLIPKCYQDSNLQSDCSSDVLYFNCPLAKDKEISQNSNKNGKLVLSNVSKELVETDLCSNKLSSQINCSQKESLNNNSPDSKGDEEDQSPRDKEELSLSSEVIENGMSEQIDNKNLEQSNCSGDNKIVNISKLESAVNDIQNNLNDKEIRLPVVNNETNTDVKVNGVSSTSKCESENNGVQGEESNNSECDKTDNSECEDEIDCIEGLKVPRAPIFNGSHNFVMRGSLKRKAEDSDNEEPKKKRAIKFDQVTVFYFPRSQGFNCVPSQGGSTLGMSRKHFSIKKFSLSEHAAEQRRNHRDLLVKMRQRKKRKKEGGSQCSSSEDSEDNSEEVSDISDSELEAESIYFLQPLPIRKRRAMLHQSGIRQIECLEKDECKSIRNSRELCGCQCKVYCDPTTCQCSLAGIKCQVDRHNFPCGCSRDGCSNPSGRIEFNPIRVRTHFLHTLMRLELEKCHNENPQWSLPGQSQQNGLQDGTDSCNQANSDVPRVPGLPSWLQGPRGVNIPGSASFGATQNAISPFFPLTQEMNIEGSSLSTPDIIHGNSTTNGLYNSFDNRTTDEGAASSTTSGILFPQDGLAMDNVASGSREDSKMVCGAASSTSLPEMNSGDVASSSGVSFSGNVSNSIEHSDTSCSHVTNTVSSSSHIGDLDNKTLGTKSMHVESNQTLVDSTLKVTTEKGSDEGCSTGSSDTDVPSSQQKCHLI